MTRLRHCSETRRTDIERPVGGRRRYLDSHSFEVRPRSPNHASLRRQDEDICNVDQSKRSSGPSAQRTGPESLGSRVSGVGRAVTSPRAEFQGNTPKTVPKLPLLRDGYNNDEEDGHRRRRSLRINRNSGNARHRRVATSCWHLYYNRQRRRNNNFDSA